MFRWIQYYTDSKRKRLITLDAYCLSYNQLNLIKSLKKPSKNIEGFFAYDGHVVHLG